MEASNIPDLPPGFRFHPTDEELIMYYLKNQLTPSSCRISVISEVDIYKFEPWELPDKAKFGEKEWYFFTPRNRKYPNGMRPNRATISGYWKATGTDKRIKSGSNYVGVKKTLVFYQGRPPNGLKTNWIMNEYRLGDPRTQPTRLSGSMRLDEWVLCRIYNKGNSGKTKGEAIDSCVKNTDIVGHIVCNEDALQFLPRTFSFGHLLDSEFLSFPQFLTGNSFNSEINIDTKVQNGNAIFHQE
ncbi:hypothetical protein ACHQM5_006356 [Ranunculus cassubicifolius]